MKTYITALKPIFVLALLALPAFAAFPNGYSYCKVVTTSATMVSGTSDLINYPLTVILADNDLRTVANSGFVNNANGYDIGFYPDCSGSGAPLKWEMESYSPTTGAIVAHVLRPTLSHTANDTIGMFYGGSFSSFQSTASAVWDVNYLGVWHLPNGTTLSANDSTANARHLTINGALGGAAGQIDGGTTKMDGSTQYLSNLSIASPNSITYSLWTNIATADAAYGQGGLYFANGSTASPRILSHMPYSDKVLYWDYGNATGNDGRVSTNYASYMDAWTYVTLTYDNSTGVHVIYLNGSQIVSNTHVVANPSLTGIAIGRYGDSSPAYDKRKVDELRLSNIARSGDWTLTEYRNQSAPGTYISTGPRMTSAARARHIVIGGI
jgi:hypothetical protein